MLHPRIHIRCMHVYAKLASLLESTWNESLYLMYKILYLYFLQIINSFIHCFFSLNTKINNNNISSRRNTIRNLKNKKTFVDSPRPQFVCNIIYSPITYILCPTRMEFTVHKYNIYVRICIFCAYAIIIMCPKNTNRDSTK